MDWTELRELKEALLQCHEQNLATAVYVKAVYFAEDAKWLFVGSACIEAPSQLPNGAGLRPGQTVIIDGDA